MIINGFGTIIFSGICFTSTKWNQIQKKFPADKVAVKIKDKAEAVPSKRKIAVHVAAAEHHQKMTRHDFLQKTDVALLETRKKSHTNTQASA